MTTEGREKVEVAVYKERTTTHDERILMHDESGQDTSNKYLGQTLTGFFWIIKGGNFPSYILFELQRDIPTTGSINAIIHPGEVAVLVDNINIWSSLRSHYKTPCTILNRQFHFNYIVQMVCNI